MTKAPAISLPSLYKPLFPETWNEVVLYDLARWINGMAFRDIHFTPEGRPIIKIAEIKNGITGQTKFSTNSYEEEYFIQPGDMLFSWSGQPETSIDSFIWRGPEGWLNQHIFKVLVDSGRCSYKFFYYLLKYLKPNFIRIARNKQTTGLGHVTKADLQRMVVRVPDKSTQQSVSSTLSSLDDKIELLRRQNETLEQIAQAIFNEWFVEFNFPDKNGNPYKASGGKMVDSELGPIPEGWRVEPIGDHVKCVGGSTPSTGNPAYWEDGTIPFLTPKDLSQLTGPVVMDSERRVTALGVDQISSGILSANTIVMSSRAPIGYLAVTVVPVVINQGIIGMICDRTLPSSYVYDWVKANMNRIKASAGGSTFDEINKTSFRAIEAVIPDSRVLSIYSTTVLPLSSKIIANAKQCTLLARMRDTLLPKLMSGAFRVGG